MKKIKSLFAMILSIVMGFSSLFTLSVNAASTPEALPLPTITGDQRTDIIAVAESQVGYTEGSGDNTIYGTWAGTNGYSWCAAFISWCANQANIPTSVIPKCTTVMSGQSFRKIFGDWDQYYQISCGTTACDCEKYSSGMLSASDIEPGDILLLETNGSDHVGLAIEPSDGNVVLVIDGNSGGKVKRQEYSIDKVHGICRPAYNTPYGTSNVPTAYLDVVSGMDGKVYIKGWAFDRDDLDATLKIHCYISEPGSGSLYTTVANQYRPDVNEAYGNAVGNYHGFSTTFEVAERGTHTIYVYAIDTTTNDNNVFIGCKTVYISEPFSIDFSENPLLVKQNESAIIDIDFGGEGIYTLSCSNSNKKVCNVAWGATTNYSTGETSLKITGLQPGTATLTFKLLDRNYLVLYSRSFSMVVE